MDFLWYVSLSDTHTHTLLKPGLLVPGRGVRKQLWTGVRGHMFLPLGGDTSTTPPLVSSEPHPNLGPVSSRRAGGMEELSWPSGNKESILNRPLNCQQINSPQDHIWRKLSLKNSSRWDFPGGSVVKTPRSQSRGPRFDPWLGN